MSTASLNEVQLIGNIGADIVLRKVGDDSITTISLATTFYRGEAEHTEWHRVVLRRQLAERAQKYLRKGSSIFIGGYLSTRKWTDKEGVERYTTEVVAENMQMLGGRRPEEATGEDAGEGARSAPQSQAPAYEDNDGPF